MEDHLINAFKGHRDPDGLLHIGDARAACWNCGAREIKYSGNGRVALHHPGSECCAPAIKRLLALNRQELARHRSDAASFKQAVFDMQDKAASGVGRDAAEARAKSESMKRALDARIRDYWTPITDGAHGEPGLKQEIERLERKLARLEVVS